MVPQKKMPRLRCATSPLSDLAVQCDALQDERLNLWSEIGLHVLADQELAKKPQYCFQPYVPQSGFESVQRTQAMTAGVLFMQAVLAATARAEREPVDGWKNLAQSISDARDKLDSALGRTMSVEMLRDTSQSIGRVKAFSKQLDDMAKNLVDLQKAVSAKDGLQTMRLRQTNQAALQNAILRYVEIAFALDESMTTLAADWKIKSDRYAPISYASANGGPAGSAHAEDQGRPAPEEPPVTDGDWKVFEGSRLLNAFDFDVRAVDGDAGIELTKGVFGQEHSVASSRATYKLPLEVEFVVVGFPDGCYDVQPRIGEFKLCWGEDYNKHNYLYVNSDSRYEAPHVRIVPRQENVIRMSVDAGGHVKISINGQQAFDRNTYYKSPGDVKVYLGGGIGHVEYRKVKIREVKPTDNAAAPHAVADAPVQHAEGEKAVAEGQVNTEAQEKVWEGSDLQSAFDFGPRATNGDAGIDLAAAQFPADRSNAQSKVSFKAPCTIEFTVSAKADSCLDVCPGFGDIELRWGDAWNSKTFLYAGEDVRFEAPHVRIVPGQDNSIRMHIGGDGRVVISINSQEVFNRKTDRDPTKEAKIVLGGGIGHIEYSKVRILRDVAMAGGGPEAKKTDAAKSDAEKPN